jgi:AcrR family transcriptional regulator
MIRPPGADLRDRIAEEATAIVRRAGSGALTMRALAEKLGCSPAALYMHFKDKREVLRAVADAGVAELGAGMQPLLEQADPRRALAEATRFLVRWGLANPALYRLMFDDERLTDLPDEERAPRVRLWAATRDTVARGVATGVFRRDVDVDVLIWLHWCTTHGFVMLGHAGRNPALSWELGRNQAQLLDALVEERMALLVTPAPPRKRP